MGKSAYKELRRSVGKAINGYEMIRDGDSIAVGVSGGADSLTLMWFLRDRLRRIPISYTLVPIYIDPGFEMGFAERLRDHCAEAGYAIHVEYTDYGVISHTDYNRENPCFLCARLRRKRLFELADQHGCDKLALGHNKDDLIETLFLNMCYGGEMSTMLPSQSLFNGRFTVIRPLAFCDEAMIRRFAKDRGFPEFVNACPSANRSQRSDIKRMLENLYRSNRKIKGNIFRAMRNVKTEYLPKPV